MAAPPVSPSYSPRERTALVFTGTGTAGAYHAGVLKALVEAGVRVDLVAGRGMGAVTAMFAAVDAAGQLWEPAGAWCGRPGPRGLYAWRRPWRVLAAAVLASVGVMALPLAALLVLAVIYPLCLAVMLASPTTGGALMDRWYGATAFVVGPSMLASVVPRLVTLAFLVAVGTAFALYVRAKMRAGPARHTRGALWWHVLGAPLDGEGALHWALQAFWRFVRGATTIAQPADDDLGRRYAELLGESLGQPTYRELMIAAHDLDSRRDIVFAHVSDSWRKLVAERSGGAGGDFVDLASSLRAHVVDAIAAALAPALVAEPRHVTFAPDSHWRGETHRLIDRPGSITRLLQAVADAGATQVILVSATAPRLHPHELARPPFHPRERIAETLDALESAAVDDAVRVMAGRFGALFTIRPVHNPVGAFAFSGRHDERSDRFVTLSELVDRGFDDAYRQFLEPVIGASGEQIHGVTVLTRTPDPETLRFKQQA
ncbi:MAG: patatin-like phospholipase family protein [Vicinamibacterales bacterium]